MLSLDLTKYTRIVRVELRQQTAAESPRWIDE